MRNLRLDDSVQSVLQRAVQEKVIQPIYWKDVDSWRLCTGGDGQPFVTLRQGTRPVRLADLPPIPANSTLVVSRQQPLTKPLWWLWGSSRRLHEPAVRGLAQLRSHIRQTLQWREEVRFNIYAPPMNVCEVEYGKVENDSQLARWCQQYPYRLKSSSSDCPLPPLLARPEDRLAASGHRSSTRADLLGRRQWLRFLSPRRC